MLKSSHILTKPWLHLFARNAGTSSADYKIVDHTFDAVVVGAGFAVIFLYMILSHYNLGGAGLRAAMGLSEGGMKTGFSIWRCSK